MKNDSLIALQETFGKFIKLQLLIWLGLGISFGVNAGQYTGAAKIKSFRHIDSSGMFVMIGGWDKAKAEAEGCTNSSKWVVGPHSAYDSDEALTAAFSMVMAAHLSGTTIELYIDGCNASGQALVKTIWLPSRY